MRTSYIEKLAYGMQPSPFHTNDFNWNALNAYNQPQQMGQGGGGGGSFMNGLGALMMPMLMNGMLGENAAPEDNRSYAEHFRDKTKAVGDFAKAAPGHIADAGAFVGRNFSPSGIFESIKDSPKNVSEAASNLWNAKPGERGAAWGSLGLASLVPGVAAGGAAYGAMKSAPGWANKLRGATSGAYKSMGLPTLQGGKGGLSGLWQGMKSFGTKVPGASTLGNAGRVGLAAAGKAVGGLGLGMTLYDEAAGNTDYDKDYGYGGVGNFAINGLRAMGNNLSAAGSGFQTAGPMGAVAGAGAHLVTGIGRGAYDIGKAWSEGAEAEAGAKKWEDRVATQNKLKAQMGDANWKKHVELQRAAGKRSWDAPAYKPEQLTAPAAGPTPSPAVQTAPPPKGPTEPVGPGTK